MSLQSIERLITIKTNSSTETANIMSAIHNSLIGNEDYINCNIVLNDSDTRRDGTENEVRVYIFPECKNIPQIII